MKRCLMSLTLRDDDGYTTSCCQIENMAVNYIWLINKVPTSTCLRVRKQDDLVHTGPKRYYTMASRLFSSSQCIYPLKGLSVGVIVHA